jgi:hypothetical protein
LTRTHRRPPVPQQQVEVERAAAHDGLQGTVHYRRTFPSCAVKAVARRHHPARTRPARR